MTIREYTEQAVRKYLRTVLLVDDQLFPPKSENGTGQEDGGALDLSGAPDTSVSVRSGFDHEMERFEQSEEVFRHPLNEAPDRNPLDDVSDRNPLDDVSDRNPLDDVSDRNPLDDVSDRNPLDETPSQSTETFSPQKVINGFYQSGIVCGLYEPKTSDFSNGAVPSTLVDLCDHSDVFILDWKLKGNQPDSPVPILIEQLLKRDESCGEPRAVRFCAIYTDAALGTVFSALHSEIKTRFPRTIAEEDLPNYRIHLGGLTIRLYRKTDAPEAAGNPERFVSSANLAEKIVQDFVTEYEGIMSATALRGIADIRSNAKRILDKFPKGMNSALVLHAGLTLNEKSIVADMSSLLGDEMSSILSDMRISPNDVYDLCAEYVNTCEEDVFARTNDNVFSGRATSAKIKTFLTEVFTQKTYTPSSEGRLLECVFNKRRDNVHLLNTFKTFVERQSASAKDYIFGELSALFCQRTIYSNQKTLQFGTIVRKCSADGNPSQKYYLCLMPTCDSIRLEDDVTDETGVAHPVPHRFPFWELDFVSPEGEHRTHGLYVKVDGQYHSLCAKGKIRDKFHLMDFHSRQKVVPFDESGTLVCVNGDVKLEWIAELKSAHVQRIAERISREFSRVGLSESEWLRLQVD